MWKLDRENRVIYDMEDKDPDEFPTIPEDFINSIDYYEKFDLDFVSTKDKWVVLFNPENFMERCGLRIQDHENTFSPF